MQNIFALHPFTCQEPPLFMTTCIYYYTFVIRFKNNYNVCVSNKFFVLSVKEENIYDI